MKHNWIGLEEAAERYSRHTLNRDLQARTTSPHSTNSAPRKSNAHPNREANALLRSLQQFLAVHADVEMMIRFNGLWKSLNEADRMNGIKIAYDLDNRLGMATALSRDVLCECKVREDTLQQAFQDSSGDVPIKFAVLNKDLGFPLSEKTAVRYSANGKLPPLISKPGEIHMWPRLASQQAIKKLWR